MYQWVDGVMAYHVRKRRRDLRPGCFSVTVTKYRADYEPHMLPNKCDRGLLDADYICEYFDHEATRHTGLEAAQRTKVTLLDLTMDGVDLNFENLTLVKCPLNHVTHSFLACDTQSACWANDLDLDRSASCRPPLASTLPPYYACADGVAHVPYTMVCDHRPDCTDHSDETFCVFSPCRADDHFECGDRQVSTLLARSAEYNLFVCFIA